MVQAAPEQFRLRPARAEDADAIKKMVRRARLNPMGLHWQRFIVAVDKAEEVVGCIQHKPHGRHIVELASLVVKRDRRGQGLARQLILALKEKTGAPLWLMCHSRLAHFYTRFGFVEKRRVPLYFRLSRLLTNLVLRFSKTRGYLAIMVWEDQE